MVINFLTHCRMTKLLGLLRTTISELDNIYQSSIPVLNDDLPQRTSKLFHIIALQAHAHNHTTIPSRPCSLFHKPSIPP